MMSPGLNKEDLVSLHGEAKLLFNTYIRNGSLSPATRSVVDPYEGTLWIRIRTDIPNANLDPHR